MRIFRDRRGALSISAGLAALLCACASLTLAGNPARIPVSFSITQDVGAENEVFVLGGHRDLSSGGIQQFGVKLHWSTGNVWSAPVALEAGAAVTYTYYKHLISVANYCSASSTAISGLLGLTAPSAPAPPYPGKFIRYYSSWSSANLLYRDNTIGGAFTQVAMARVGEGRTAGESVFELGAIASPANEIEFVFNDGAGHYDNAPAPPYNTPQGAAPGIPVPYQSLTPPYNYRTSLDVFTVQDGQVYNYQPPATVSAPSITPTTSSIAPSAASPGATFIFISRAVIRKTPAAVIRWFTFTTGRMSSFPAAPLAPGTPTGSPTTRPRRAGCGKPSWSRSITAMATGAIAWSNTSRRGTSSRSSRRGRPISMSNSCATTSCPPSTITTAP